MKQTKTNFISTKTVETRLKKLIALKKQISELQTQYDLIKDGLKTNMDKLGLSSLQGETLYCYYKDVCKVIADTDKMKLDGIYNQYSKKSEYKMFDYKPIK